MRDRVTEDISFQRKFRQMISVPTKVIDQLIDEVAHIQIRRHAQPPKDRHRRIIQGKLHDILPSLLRGIHQRGYEGGDDFVRVEITHGVDRLFWL